MKLYNFISYLISRQHSVLQILNASTAHFIRSKKLPYQPVELLFSPTDRCTLGCVMCINHSPDLDSIDINEPGRHVTTKDLSFALFKKILDLFPRAMRVSLAGIGEPLLNSDIFQMINYARKKRMNISIISNGTLLSAKLNSIIKYPPDAISISLNAPTADEFSKISTAPSGNFDKIVDGINKLVESKRKLNLKMEIGLSCVLKKSLIDFSAKMIDLANSLHVDFLDFHNLIPSSMSGCGSDECLYEDDKEIIDLFNNLRKVNSKVKINFPVLLKRKPNSLKCESFFKILYIDGEGNVSGCCRYFTPSKENGSVFDKNIWNNKYFIDSRKRFLSKTNQVPKVCKYCVELSRD